MRGANVLPQRHRQRAADRPAAGAGEANPGRGVEPLAAARLLDVAPVSGALDTLQRLRDEGYVLGVVSSAGWPPFVEMALEAEGMRPFFTEVTTSAGEGIYKRDPVIFLRAVSRLGFEPEEAVHVGDHARFDVQTARSAGLHTVWFAAHAQRTAHLHNADWDTLAKQGLDADAVIYALPELLAVLNKGL